MSMTKLTMIVYGMSCN